MRLYKKLVVFHFVFYIPHSWFEGMFQPRDRLSQLVLLAGCGAKWAPSCSRLYRFTHTCAHCNPPFMDVDCSPKWTQNCFPTTGTEVCPVAVNSFGIIIFALSFSQIFIPHCRSNKADPEVCFHCPSVSFGPVVLIIRLHSCLVMMTQAERNSVTKVVRATHIKLSQMASKSCMFGHHNRAFLFGCLSGLMIPWMTLSVKVIFWSVLDLEDYRAPSSTTP